MDAKGGEQGVMVQLGSGVSSAMDCDKRVNGLIQMNPITNLGRYPSNEKAGS